MKYHDCYPFLEEEAPLPPGHRKPPPVGNSGRNGVVDYDHGDTVIDEDCGTVFRERIENNDRY